MEKKYLDLAFFYANVAFMNDEIPVGAVIVKNNSVISYGYNFKESENSVFGHAELMAIRNAEKVFNNWRLNDCDIYITLDPCPMCASAIKQSRIKNVYSALNNDDSDNFSIICNIFKADKNNSSVNFISNLDSRRSQILLKSFFQKKRK